MENRNGRQRRFTGSDVSKAVSPPSDWCTPLPYKPCIESDSDKEEMLESPRKKVLKKRKELDVHLAAWCSLQEPPKYYERPLEPPEEGNKMEHHEESVIESEDDDVFPTFSFIAYKETAPIDAGYDADSEDETMLSTRDTLSALFNSVPWTHQWPQRRHSFPLSKHDAKSKI